MRNVLGIALALALVGCKAKPGTDDPATEDPTPTDCSARETLTAEIFVGGGSLDPGTCWHVDSALWLDDGIFTVGEGVDITFATDVPIEVAAGGQLALRGTEAAPIRLHTADPLVTWRGIAYTDSQGSDNVWEHVEIENAGNDNWNGADDSFGALWVDGSSTVSLSDVVFRNNNRLAMNVRGNDPALTLSNIIFEGGMQTAWVSAEVASIFGSETRFTDVEDPRIRVGGYLDADTIDEDRTWAALDVPYLLEGSVYVEAIWTLAPGVDLDISEDRKITVADGGALIAEGTAEAPITMNGTAPDTPGFWVGIEVTSSGVPGSLDFGASFDHTEISGTGSDSHNGNSETVAGLFLAGPGVTRIQNTTLVDAEGYGMWAGGEHPLPDFTGNTFTNCGVPMRLAPERVGDLDTATVITGNIDDRIEVGVSSLDNTLDTPAEWKDLDVPYHFTLSAWLDAAVTVQPGTEFEFGQDIALYVNTGASLNAVGTDADPIVFRGTSSDATGFWTGIRFDSNSADNVLTNAEVMDAGSDAWSGNSDQVASLMLGADAQLHLEDSRVGPGGGYTAWLAADAVLTCVGTNIDGTNGVWDTDVDAVVTVCL